MGGLRREIVRCSCLGDMLSGVNQPCSIPDGDTWEPAANIMDTRLIDLYQASISGTGGGATGTHERVEVLVGSSGSILPIGGHADLVQRLKDYMQATHADQSRIAAHLGFSSSDVVSSWMLGIASEEAEHDARVLSFLSPGGGVHGQPDADAKAEAGANAREEGSSLPAGCGGGDDDGVTGAVHEALPGMAPCRHCGKLCSVAGNGIWQHQMRCPVKLAEQHTLPSRQPNFVSSASDHTSGEEMAAIAELAAARVDASQACRQHMTATGLSAMQLVTRLFGSKGEATKFNPLSFLLITICAHTTCDELTGCFLHRTGRPAYCRHWPLWFACTDGDRSEPTLPGVVLREPDAEATSTAPGLLLKAFQKSLKELPST